ncbi:MAG: glycerol kinase GlpK [Silvanigrellaceae bacterium]|nr:glycerol kinase GlpK [Silvanigrellaceae bacterium]
MKNFILSLDAGTTGVQASLFSMNDMIMYGNNKVEFRQIYPQPGYVEHNPEDIWAAISKAIANTIEIAHAKIPHFRESMIEGIGITNQRETCIAWNKVTGEIAYNALVWQDRRTAEFCNRIKKDKALNSKIQIKTGLVCDPYFSASKMQWLLENIPAVKRWQSTGELALGTIDSYLIWKLSSGKFFVTDHTNASRTMLYNLNDGCYDEELLHIFGVQKTDLPVIIESIGRCAATLNCAHLPNGIPIYGILGDQQAALFGQNAFAEGDAKVTFGTGAFLLMNTGNKPYHSTKGLLTTVAFSAKNTRLFALEGAAFVAGAAIQFFRDNFSWYKNSAESQELLLSEPADNSLLFIPSLAGLGAPYWNPNAKGALFGLTRGTKKEQIIRAATESVAFQNVQIFHLMEEACGKKIVQVGVDGGASRNNYLMQFQADILQTTLLRPANTESTSRGAALAALVGMTEDLNILESFKHADNHTVFTPQMNKETAQKRFEYWLRAVECINNFYEKNL